MCVCVCVCVCVPKGHMHIHTQGLLELHMATWLQSQSGAETSTKNGQVPCSQSLEQGKQWAMLGRLAGKMDDCKQGTCHASPKSS